MKIFFPVLLAGTLLLAACSGDNKPAPSGNLPALLPAQPSTAEKEKNRPNTEINATTVISGELLELKVKEIHIGTGFDITTRKIAGEGERLTATAGKLWCYTIITGASRETFIRHVYYYKGRQIADVKLDVKFPVFSTWSSKTVLPEWKGDWNLKVIDFDGRVIGEKNFIVE